MKKSWATALGVAILVLAGIAFLDPRSALLGYLKGDSFFAGRPTTFWRKVLTDPNPGVQEQARKTLKEGRTGAVPVLAELLQEQKTDWHTVEPRWTAAEILGQIGPEARAATPGLLAALKDTDAHIRTVAATALAEIQAPATEAVPALIAMLATEDRLTAAKSLARYGPEAKAAVPTLTELLRDRDADVRWNAARTLGGIGREAAFCVPVLVETLKDQDPAVREHAAESLGLIGTQDREVIAGLIQALKTRNRACAAMPCARSVRWVRQPESHWRQSSLC
jgi:HEAT repeat protein